MVDKTGQDAGWARGDGQAGGAGLGNVKGRELSREVRVGDTTGRLVDWLAGHRCVCLCCLPSWGGGGDCFDWVPRVHRQCLVGSIEQSKLWERALVHS